MIDEALYEKHSNAITTSQHTEISVEYAIELLDNMPYFKTSLEYPDWVNRKIKELKALLK